MQNNHFFFSVVVPCHNEAAHLEQFVKSLKSVCEEINPQYEILIINDGSKDNTNEVIKPIMQLGKIRYIEFSRNFGKESALMAGIDLSKGDAVALIDADFQHPIDKLKEMHALWDQGYEMIYGVIENRVNESFRKRLGTRLFYSLMNTAEITIPENAGDFRWLDRKVVNALKQLPERNRFMKGLYAWVGFKSYALPFTPNNRLAGVSSFSFSRLLKLALSGLTSFSTIPLQLWIILGALISITAVIYGVFVAIDTLIYGNAVNGWPTLTVALMLFSGVQLLSIGILGEYIGRIFNEVKQRPLYIVSEDISSPEQCPV